MAAGASHAKLVFVNTRAHSLPHVRPVQERQFPASEPASEKMGQSTRHFLLCKALCEMLAAVCSPEHTVGADNFVYFDASDPKRKLAPDAFVKLGRPWEHFESYLAWEEGTPEVAFEILSPSDTPERWTFEEKLRRYLALGVRELIVFNVDAEPGKRIRVWDRLDHDLVERIVEDDAAVCLTLDLGLRVGPADFGNFGRLPLALRLTRDPEGRDLVRTDAENVAFEAAARAAETAAHAKADAEAKDRIAELELRLAERETSSS